MAHGQRGLSQLRGVSRLRWSQAWTWMGAPQGPRARPAPLSHEPSSMHQASSIFGSSELCLRGCIKLFLFSKISFVQPEKCQNHIRSFKYVFFFVNRKKRECLYYQPMATSCVSLVLMGTWQNIQIRLMPGVARQCSLCSNCSGNCQQAKCDTFWTTGCRTIHIPDRI